MTGKICGTGSCVPPFVMDNNDIAKLVETSDEWIRERTGVIRRHIIKGETTVSMAAEAGRRALENAGIAAEDLELILVATISSNTLLPCTACEVQKELGAVNATAFDLGGAACTGFLLAYNTAMAYLDAGVCRTALVIGSESLSTLTDWNDRRTCILFGDGAGAAVLRAGDPCDGKPQEAGRSYRPVTHSDGARGRALTCKGRYDFIRMDGREVFQFAVKKVPEVIEEALSLNGLTKGDIDLYIVHQANRRIVEAVAKRLGEPIGKFPMNVQEYGNTSAASIPILLDELNRSGRLTRGQRLVFAGFGAGLIWGASVADWQGTGKKSIWERRSIC